MSLYWIALAMIFCSFLGYRIALENRLSGFTGLLFGLGISALVATEIWRFGLQAIYTSNIVASLIAVAASGLGATFVLHKFKFLAYFKLIGWLVPFAVASIGVPSYTLNWNSVNREKTPLIQDWDPAGADSGSAEFGTTQRVVATETRLYRQVNGTFVKTSVVLREGARLELGEDTAAAFGGRWVAVELVRRDRTFTGFVPVSALR